MEETKKLYPYYVMKSNPQKHFYWEELHGQKVIIMNREFFITDNNITDGRTGCLVNTKGDINCINETIIKRLEDIEICSPLSPLYNK